MTAADRLRATKSKPLVIAIDGPAGAGKSTVARRLARQLGLPFVDTGAMYRAAALHVSERGINPDDSDAVAGALPDLDLELAWNGTDAEIRLHGGPVEGRIRSAAIGALTSRVARHAELRARLVKLQRDFVKRHGGVMEGRDIGTVVVPDTPFKFYLDASMATRAGRRHAELAARGEEGGLESISKEIAERDERDSKRAISPLAAAPDAIPISSDGLTVDQVVERLRSEIARISG
jgi:cytidylate kinase